MRVLKGLLLFALHFGSSLGVQLLLLGLLLEQLSSLRCVLFSVLLCLFDLVLSCLLLKGRLILRSGQVLLHFWDLFLMIPVLLPALFGFVSDGRGVGFGLTALLLELLLIVERSSSYVLFSSGPDRNGESRSGKFAENSETDLAAGSGKV